MINERKYVWGINNIIMVFAILLLSISCKQEPIQKNNSYFEPDSTTRLKLLNIEKDSLYDSLVVQAICNKDEWVKDLDERDIKRNHVILLRVTVDASRWENPVLVICGQLNNLSIFQADKLLYESEERHARTNSRSTKILNVNPEKNLNIYLCFYYENIFELTDISFFRIGENSNVADGALILTNAFELFSSLNLGFIFETIGLISFFALFFYSGRNRRMLFFFAIFLITVGFSTLQEVVKFMLPIQLYYFNLIVFISATLIPLSFLGFLYNAIVIKQRKVFLAAIVVNLIWCVALPLLSLTVQVSIVYWGGMLLVVLLIVALLLTERVYRNPEFRYPLCGFIFLIVLLVIGGLNDFGVISLTINVDYGILIFVISLLIYTVQNIVKSRKEVLEVNIALQQSQNRLLVLENENINSQFEALKGQLNPHFLFNSLNTLASLINIDKARATKYVEEFSQLYRRLLDTKSETLVSLGDELLFLNSFIYLQKIRYGDNLLFSFEIHESAHDKLVPPLSLQLLIENALKHNEVSEDFPLLITLRCVDNYLEISNPLQPKMEMVYRKGIGLENLRKRYLQVSDRDIIIENAGREFIVKIPLIEEF